jgi:hypothetical protein
MSKIRTQRDRELMGVAIQIVSMCPESSRDALQVLNYARNIIRELSVTIKSARELDL